jgi:three-Cys-motif partner protein
MPKKEHCWNIGDPPPTIKPHSIAKQKIYAQYIEKYIHTLNPSPMIPKFKLVVIDGFAGGGVYSTSDGEHNGSPVQIIKAVKKAEAEINATRNNTFTIQQKYFFIEKKKSNFIYLKQHLTNLEYDKYFNSEIILQKGEFEKLYKSIVGSILSEFGENVRAIFILDQYGYTDAPFSIFRKIFTSLPNAEIILTISVDHLIDYIQDPERKVKQQADIFGYEQKIITHSGIQLQKTLKNGFGLDLKELYSIKNSEPLWRGVIEHLIIEKLKLFSGAKFYTPFFLSEEGRSRSMWVVHLSNHPQARNVMGQVHWDVATQNEIKMSHHGYHGLNMLGYNVQNDKDYIHNILNGFEDFSFNAIAEKKMKKKVMEEFLPILHNTPTSFGEFYTQVANHTPAHKGQLKDCAKELLQMKELSVVGKNGEQRRLDIKDTDIIQVPPQSNFIF